MLTTTLMSAVLVVCSGISEAHARLPLVDVSVVDRVPGDTLAVYTHRGQRWVAGTPGNRHSIVLHNRSATRVLAVLSVDGVNAISGESASWDQAGYVLDPGERAEIRGWRKSLERVAAFEFSALSDSYAARTGRPENVGIIGVALFREAPRPKAKIAPGVAGRAEAQEAPAAAASGSSDSAGRPAPGLGNGHGRSETSFVRATRFGRAQSRPDQVVAIRYDSRPNLIAMGVIEAPGAWRPEPFPGIAGFVPDPPRP